METCQGYLLDILEKDVEDAMEKGCERWMRDEANVELFGPAGAVAVRYGVGVESTATCHTCPTNLHREMKQCVHGQVYMCVTKCEREREREREMEEKSEI